MKKILSIITCAAAFIMLAGLCIHTYSKNRAYDVDPLTVSKLVNSGADSADKLMITAHPDDEVLWGGGHLMDGGYFIVCVTNGRNETRSSEFEKVLAESGNNGIILDYPDKVGGKRDDWSGVQDKIKNDLQLVMNYKDWELIVTHNQKGEYKHQHHVMTHEFVTEIFEETGTDSQLWYFGKYYKKTDLENVKSTLESMDQERISFKEKLESIYISQSDTIAKLSHMNSYENWTQYSPQEQE
ncbi:MAG: PIG-L family deacetylase [Porcipelethomonas sp.]